jgi:Ca2+-binding RTX toxin-like protein
MSDGLPIIGTEDPDLLQGTEFSEEIYGLGGDDIVDGGDGDDSIDGGEGADHLTGGAGDDVYVIDEFDTVVEIDGGGDDEVRTSASAYALAHYVERLTGLSQDGQELIGNSLDNIIVGGAGGDVLRGGLGNDSLTGGDGSDIYLFWRGDGDDQISVGAGSGRDALQFDFDIFESHVTVTQSGYDLILTVGDGGGSVTLLGSGSSFTQISEIIFGDGIVWSNADLLSHSTSTTGEGPDTLTGDENDNVIAGLGGDDVLDGAAGDDTLEGGEGDDILSGGIGADTLEGGEGDDFLAGGEGDDIFRFQPGFGDDTIADADGSAGGGNDRIQFLGSILPGDVTLTIEGNDVLVSIAGTTDRIRLKDMMVDPASMIEEFAFADGTVSYVPWLIGPQFHYGTEAADTLQGGTLTNILYGLGGDDSLSGGASSDSIDGGAGDDSLYGGGQADYLDGGSGNDLLVGGTGGDTYGFFAGMGHDVIRDEGEAGGFAAWDEIYIGYDLAIYHSDITVGRSQDGFSYILYFGDGSNSITLYGAASGDPRYQIERIEFGMGAMHGNSLGGRARDVGNGDDILTGADSWDMLRGLGGDDVIDGGAGGGRLKGDAGDDTLIGGDGYDLLEGGVGADVLNGGGGDDWLDGGAGADQMTGGDGNDIYYADDAGDSIVEAAGAGQDEVRTTAAAYALSAGVERLMADTASGHVLTGNGLDNIIGGGGGDDVMAGGAGNDELWGRGGANIYRFARGDGDDSVSDWDSLADAIEFSADILPGDVRVSISGSSIVLTVDGGGGSVTIVNGTGMPDMFEVRFGGGTVWTYNDIMNQSLTGTEEADVITGDYQDNILLGRGGDDVLNGDHGDDILEGGAGNDSVAGGDGTDTYRFARGDGDDVVSDWNPGNVLEFSVGILPGDVRVRVDGPDIILTVNNGGGSVRLVYAVYYTGVIETRFADGTVWTHDDLVDQSLTGSEEAELLTGYYRENVIRGLGGDDALIGSYLGDLLEGGAGSDLLAGDYGDDRYRFERGFGDDVIQEAKYGYGGYDRIEFMGDILPGEVTIWTTDGGRDLVISITGTTDRIRLDDAIFDDSLILEEIVFADGTVWTAAHLLASVVAAPPLDNEYFGTAGADALTGGVSGDILHGAAGDDALDGGAGSDHLDGGVGTDALKGGAGNDIYYFQSGDGHDVIREWEGAGYGGYDTLQLGPGLRIEEVTVGLSADGLSYILYFGGGEESITIYGAASAQSGYEVEIVRFADANWFNHAQMESMATQASNGDDILAAGNSWAGTRGLGGNDLIEGSEGWDVLKGDSGDDILNGGGGNDELHGGAGSDQLAGGPGNDVYMIDELDSLLELPGEGQDEVRTSAAAYVLGDHFERLTGKSTDGQALTGNELDNIISGGSGGDVLRGGLGDDHLAGWAGSDLYLFSRGDGDDTIFVHWGTERDGLLFDFDILPGDVTVTQSDHNLILTIGGGGGSVTLLGDGGYFTRLSEVIFGDGTVWSKDDLIALSMTGDDGPAVMYGTNTADAMSGAGGDDTVYGQQGDDILHGGDGDDILVGGSGKDVTTGGAGADTFRFAPWDTAGGPWADRITDFTPGEDKIDISQFQMSYGGWHANGQFTLIGSSAFSYTAGEVRWFFDGTDTRIQFDPGGRGYLQHEIVLSGNVILGASDFVL